VRIPTRDDLDKTVPGKLLMGTVAPNTTNLAPGEGDPVKPASTPTPTPAPAAVKEPQWYLVIKGKRQGPFTGVQMTQMLSSGQIKPKDMVWTDGMPKWEAAQAIAPRFQPDKPKSTPIAPAPASVTRPQPTTKGRSRLGLVLGSGGAMTLMLATTIGGVLMLNNRGDNATSNAATQTTSTAANPPDLPVADIVAQVRPSMARVQGGQSQATGFLVNREFVVTNWQALADTPSASLRVSFPNGPMLVREPMPVKIVYSTARGDLVILKVTTTANSLNVAETFTPANDEAVAVAGFPDTAGDASAVSLRLGSGITSDKRTWYPIQGNLAPGYAGGPLLNTKSEVLGVASISQKAGRAIPLTDLHKALKDAQDAPDNQQALRNARHDAALLFRRLLRSEILHFKVIADATIRMQEAADKNMKTELALREEMNRTEQQRTEAKAPVVEGQALLNQIRDNPKIPEELSSALVQFHELHERIRQHLEVDQDITTFKAETKKLAERFQRQRDDLQRLLDLPPME